MKSFVKALGSYFARVIPTDVNRAFWKNHEPRPGWRTSAAVESDADAKYICDTAEKIFIEVVTLFGTKTTQEAVQTMLEGHYRVAELMLAKRKAYLSTFESRD